MWRQLKCSGVHNRRSRSPTEGTSEGSAFTDAHIIEKKVLNIEKWVFCLGRFPRIRVNARKGTLPVLSSRRSTQRRDRPRKTPCFDPASVGYHFFLFGETSSQSREETREGTASARPPSPHRCGGNPHCPTGERAAIREGEGATRIPFCRYFVCFRVNASPRQGRLSFSDASSKKESFSGHPMFQL